MPENKKCTIKIHFIRTNRIRDDDVNHKGKIWKKNEGKKKKLFFYRIFGHISLSTQPNFNFEGSLDVDFNSASNPYPHCILLRYPRHPKMKISIKKCILVPQKYAVLKYVFLLKFSFLGAVGTSKVCSVGMGWMHNFTAHQTSPQTRNLGEPIRRYAKNTIRKIVFSFSPSKFRTFILLL